MRQAPPLGRQTLPREIAYQRPYLYPKQLAAIFHDKRFGLIEASTKAGKQLPASSGY
jgi:hypothetical protein